MAIVAEFTIPAASFPLGNLFSDAPDLAVELDRIEPADDVLRSYVWVRGVDAADGESVEGIPSHAAVASTAVIDRDEEAALLRIEWRSDRASVLAAMATSDLTIISAAGAAETWSFEVRSPTREAVSAFIEGCQGTDVPVNLEALYALNPLRTGSEYDLTDAQREALLLAYEEGYYDTPREVSLEELAAEVGITPQSFGARLQRGNRRLIGSTISEHHD